MPLKLMQADINSFRISLSGRIRAKAAAIGASDPEITRILAKTSQLCSSHKDDREIAPAMNQKAQGTITAIP